MLRHRYHNESKGITSFIQRLVIDRLIILEHQAPANNSLQMRYKNVYFSSVIRDAVSPPCGQTLNLGHTQPSQNRVEQLINYISMFLPNALIMCDCLSTLSPLLLLIVPLDLLLVKLLRQRETHSRCFASRQLLRHLDDREDARRITEEVVKLFEVAVHGLGVEEVDGHWNAGADDSVHDVVAPPDSVDSNRRDHNDDEIPVGQGSA